MVKIRSFKGFRPAEGLADKIASRPYDVMNSAEARIAASGNPYSFLHIIKSEIDLAEDIDTHSNVVYERARENFDKFVNEGFLVQDEEPAMYIYQQQMGDHVQNGLVACSWIEDYFEDRIKKHEFTRPVKEKDRIDHMTHLGAHPGPVFLTYHPVSRIDEIINNHISSNQPEYNFTADDGVGHTLWIISDEGLINTISHIFSTEVHATYIADGHHRAASSSKVGKKLGTENPAHTGDEAYNFFLSVIFPSDQLMIIDYNRLVKDLNGLSKDEFFDKVSANFNISLHGTEEFKPSSPKEFGMYYENLWYRLKAIDGSWSNDPIGILDITVLSNKILDPILGIKDQRTDDRIDFVGGIRGLGELKKRVDSGEMKVAFSIYPVSINQLIDIADTGEVMPPKSTWFEPKLRSGLIIHQFEERN